MSNGWVPITSRLHEKLCRVCKSEKREEIERDLINGVSLNAIARKYLVSRDSAHRHNRNHIGDDTRSKYLAGISPDEALSTSTIASDSILGCLELVRETLMDQMLAAADSDDGHRVAVVANQIISCLSLLARFTCDLRSTVPPLLGNPENNNDELKKEITETMDILRRMRIYVDERHQSTQSETSFPMVQVRQRRDRRNRG